jgi:uncharacterized SAM-binding protein YcdF (DUF218 family)
MFWLKKVVGTLLMPLPLGLGLLTLGLLLLLFRRRTPGWLALVLGWAVLIVASNRGVSLALTASLERTYPPAPAFTETPPPDAWRTVGYVAVLGAGHGDAPGLPAGQRLSPSARGRLIEGVRLALALPDTWLVVAGPVDARKTDGLSHARVLADAAIELGLPRERIVTLDHVRDTAEEIDALVRLVDGERVALVTSAWHLPRAMQLASGAGLDSLPCPADYLGGRDAPPSGLAWLSWNVEAAADTTRAWREYLGRAWAYLVARVRG